MKTICRRRKAGCEVCASLHLVTDTAVWKETSANMLIHKACRRMARPALFCSPPCQCGCCTCVCVRAPVRAVCHAVKCVLAGCHWGSQDNPTFSLHACSSSESDHYHIASHHCPGASKFTFGQEHTLPHTKFCLRVCAEQNLYSPGRGITNWA